MRTVYRNTLYVVLALLVASVAVNFWQPLAQRWPVKEGLDLAGGTRAVLEMEEGPGTPPITGDTQSQVVQVMQNRVNALGISEPVVQAKGSRQIIVEMPQTPGKSLEQQRADLRDLIQPAKLEFIYLKDVRSKKNPAARYIYEGDNTIRDGDTNKILTPEQVQTDILYKDPSNIIVTGADLQPNGASVDIEQGPQGGPVTKLKFNDKGTRAFADFTTNHVDENLAIVLNGKIQSAPNIEQPITDGEAVIRGAGTDLPEAKTLANVLNAGALPVPLREIQSSSVQATLGQGVVKQAIVGGIVGIVLVLLFMLAYYALPGAVAAIALLVYAALTFTVFRLLGVTLTLPGIAGFILSIGMAVDANILIFERMKEELQAGRTLHAAVDAGFDRAWTSIRDSNASTLITCFILFQYGTGPIKGFALVLALGVLMSLFTAVTLSRALLHGIVNQEWSHDPKWYRVGGRTFSWGHRAETGHWDVMGRWKLWFALSALLIGIGWAFNFAHLSEYGTLVRKGIDFTGGSYLTYGVPANKSVTDAQVKQIFAANGLGDTSVQRTTESGSTGAPSNVITVRTREVSDTQVAALLGAMQKQIDPAVTQLGVEKVGPTISRELTTQAFLSVIFACLAILIYLGFVFGQLGFLDGLKYGAAAVIALFHDVLVIFGFMGLTGFLLHWELNSLFVTAALTVIGFSVHDTIVVFDRIRENLKIHGKDWTFTQVANASIIQTLSRSINTSMTVVITLAALLLLGTRGSLDLKIFTSVLLVGIISGTYSSIFNATPILAMLEGAMGRRRQAAAVRRPSAAETKTLVNPPSTPKAAEPKPSAPKAAEPQPVAPEVAQNGAKQTPPSAPKAPTTGGKKAKRRF